MEKTDFSVYMTRAEESIEGEKHNWMCVTCGRVWLMRGFAENCDHTDTVLLADRRIVRPVRREAGELTDEQINSQRQAEAEARTRAEAAKKSMQRVINLIKLHVRNQHSNGQMYFLLKEVMPAEKVKATMEEGVRQIIEANEAEGSPLVINVERIRAVQLKKFNEGFIAKKLASKDLILVYEGQEGRWERVTFKNPAPEGASTFFVTQQAMTEHVEGGKPQ